MQQVSLPGIQFNNKTAGVGSNSSQPTGPRNEVWRGKLHIRLMEGGHIYIEVAILSHFVPLTVNL